MATTSKSLSSLQKYRPCLYPQSRTMTSTPTYGKEAPTRPHHVFCAPSGGSFYLKPVLASSVAEIEPTEASVSKPVLASSVLDRHIEAAQKALLVSSVRDCAHTEALKSSGVFEVPDDSGINVTPQHLHLGMLARRQADNQVGQVLTQIGRCLGGLLYRQAGKIVAQFCEMWRM